MADERRRQSLPRKSKKTPISRPQNDDEPQTCVICLDKVSCRGKLGVCHHWFCFPCIFEWSKNTNTCPVCKMRFKCISKLHLVPGKSPVKKVRVEDVDQRGGYLDDVDFIWAALETESEEYNSSDYEPPSCDDDNDVTFASPTRIDSSDGEEVTFIDSEAEENNNVMTDESNSSAYLDDTSSSDEENMSFSDFSSNSEPDSNILASPVSRKKSTRKITLSDSEDSSDTNSDDEWQTEETNEKSQGKKRATNGFHRNRQQKRQRSTSRKFEAELERRKHASSSRTNAKQKKATSTKNNNSQRQGSVERGDCSFSSRGEWLSTARTHSSQPTSSRTIRKQSQVVSRRSRTRPTYSFSGEEPAVSMECTRSESTSARNESTSTRNESTSARNTSRSSRNESTSARNESTSARNESTSARNESTSARNESTSARNIARSPRNETRSTRSTSLQTRNHKRPTLTIEESSDDSTTQITEFSEMSSVARGSNDSDRSLRKTTRSQKTEYTRKSTRFVLQVLIESHY